MKPFGRIGRLVRRPSVRRRRNGGGGFEQFAAVGIVGLLHIFLLKRPSETGKTVFRRHHLPECESLSITIPAFSDGFKYQNQISAVRMPPNMLKQDNLLPPTPYLAVQTSRPPRFPLLPCPAFSNSKTVAPTHPAALKTVLTLS